MKAKGTPGQRIPLPQQQKGGQCGQSIAPLSVLSRKAQPGEDPMRPFCPSHAEPFCSSERNRSMHSKSTSWHAASNPQQGTSPSLLLLGRQDEIQNQCHRKLQCASLRRQEGSLNAPIPAQRQSPFPMQPCPCPSPRAPWALLPGFKANRTHFLPLLLGHGPFWSAGRQYAWL